MGYNRWDEKRAGESVDSVLSQMTEQIMSPELSKLIEQSHEESELSVEDAETEVRWWESVFVDVTPDMPTIDIDGVKYLGWLYIPEISMSLPIADEWSYENLKLAPCRYTGSLYESNMTIAGHNYESHFGPLKQLRSGDKVYFIAADGVVWSYEVMEIISLDASDVEKMTNGDWDLTLFTCNYSGQMRETIRCVEIE